MSMRSMFFATAALALTMTMPLAHADDYASGAIKSMKTDKGEVLADSKGMTLYIYDKDEKGVSNCHDKCATNWPPLAAASGASPDGDYTVIKRKDGSTQWAYDGKPLYRWKNDKAPGDMTGDGVGGVWHVAIED